ncbi:MAG: AGE family epimerase/isomerase [Anaerolineae bacterium]|nr:AGE family epimerase/isomerase [Anaerolineae bacterium]
MDKKRIVSYIDRAKAELTENILPFWLEHTVDRERGGFYGSISNDLVVDLAAERGALLCSRILWTYSAAYKRYPNPKYLDMVRWAYVDLLAHFWDDEFGGLYWAADAEGRPTNTRKQIYGQAFGVYALAEYFSAVREPAILDKAIVLFDLIETHSYDPENQGYLEAYTRKWRPEDDLRLSDVDLNEKKSMNTHLHVMEAYTNLARVWPDARLKARHRELLEVMIQRIIHPETYHTVLFFDETWHPRSDRVSFGHDIEASWLLVEAAEVAGDAAVLEQAKALAVKMAQAVYDEGLDADGGLLYEADPHGIVDANKEWWPQAEAAVGFVNAYQLSGESHFLSAALQSWEFIERHMVDREHGEWFRAVTRDGVVRDCELKVSFWRCPYHNSRACIEMIERLESLIEEGNP